MHTKKNIKQLYIFEGQNKEVFWFCKRTEDDAQIVEMYLMDEHTPEPTKHTVNPDSNLYRVLTGGQETFEDIAMPNAAPTMIKDTPGTPIVVFNSFLFSRGVPDVYFYDVKTG